MSVTSLCRLFVRAPSYTARLPLTSTFVRSHTKHTDDKEDSTAAHYVTGKNAKGESTAALHVPGSKETVTETQLENYPTAALYVPGNKAETVASVLTPHLDFSRLLENNAEFTRNIEMRGMDIDVKNVLGMWDEWGKLKKRREEIEERRGEIVEAISALEKPKKRGKKKKKKESEAKQSQIETKNSEKEIKNSEKEIKNENEAKNSEIKMRKSQDETKQGQNGTKNSEITAKEDEKIQRMAELKNQGIELRDEAKNLAQKIWKLEESAIIPLLQLPNSLHSKTPPKKSLLFTYSQKPTFRYTPKSHMEIGEILGELEFKNCSPKSYYLKKNLAVLELACQDFFRGFAEARTFLPTCNSDFVKGAVVEGSGVGYVERHRYNKLRGQEKIEENPLHLVGGGSVPGFTALVTKMMIEKEDSLPVRFVAAGRHYRPPGNENPKSKSENINSEVNKNTKSEWSKLNYENKKSINENTATNSKIYESNVEKLESGEWDQRPKGEELGLYAARQSTVVDGLVVYRDTNASTHDPNASTRDPNASIHNPNATIEREIIDETLMLLIQSYTKLGLHFKLVQYPPEDLEMYESGAFGLQIFSPALGDYVEVGRVSLIGEYISRRLWIMCKSEMERKSASFVSLMYIRFCNVTQLLGLIMENCQNENGTYDIPKNLQ